MIDTAQLHQLDAPQLREMVRSLMGAVVARDREIAFKQATIDKITHEMAVLKRLKFAARSEAFNAEQKSLLEETIDADLAALQAELDTVRPDDQSNGEKKQPKRRRCRRTCRAARSTTCQRRHVFPQFGRSNFPHRFQRVLSPGMRRGPPWMAGLAGV